MNQEKNLNEEETADASKAENADEIKNLPIESIGSYARLDDLLTDEDEEKTNNPTTQT